MLNWLEAFNIFCFLHSNDYPCNLDMLVGAGCLRNYRSSNPDALPGFQDFSQTKPSWLFGHLCYELQTHEKISRIKKEDPLHFPDLFFFEPEIVLCLQGNQLEITSVDPDTIFRDIENTDDGTQKIMTSQFHIQSSITRKDYLNTIAQLQNHIQRGDCYQINFCRECFAEECFVDPLVLFNLLNELSPNPFSGFYRIQDKWLICASPERFIKKTERKIISQPIKGTLQRRRAEDRAAEQRLLSESRKDRAENIMIADLLRNDLSKICKEGTVEADELCGIYTFPQVHQMISTISGTLQENAGLADIINATFPMGSMTGAPKIKVMQLIDRYENSKRGIFSGTLGYISPDGNFDFNVVIRSLVYNQTRRYLSFQTGGGITAYSNAEEEWEECLVKAKAIREILRCFSN